MKKKKNPIKEQNKEINQKISKEDLILKEEEEENNSKTNKSNNNLNKKENQKNKDKDNDNGEEKDNEKKKNNGKEKDFNIKTNNNEININNNESHENNINENHFKTPSENLNLLNTKRQREDYQSENNNFNDNNNIHSNLIKENQDNEKEKEEEIITQTKNVYCPYLGTIKRHLLDFDFEKVCSISLSNLNVYACLICGKYYQGCGKKTNAYTHSLQEDHHLFINLNDEKIICLPESYEVLDNSLKDIKANLKPKYSTKEIECLDDDNKNSNSNLSLSHNFNLSSNLNLNEYESTFDNNNIFSFALDGTEYIPGYIGLNNIKKTDYVNVIIQSLCRVPPLRNYFLNYDDQSTNLVNFLFIKY
jgi:U4/U6.U5 tri-snRNP-associated protein 2